VQITVAEEIGIGTRAAFYEQTGVVRDMIQNHLLQLLCMVAMEPPVGFRAKSLRDETAKVLEAVDVVPIDIEGGAVRGQYGRGSVRGERVRAYREEDGVAPDSATATYAAMQLTVDNWRWAGVQFYLRTGKRMTRGLTEVALQFKPTPHPMFALRDERAPHSSVLVFEVQPNEGIVQTLAAKQPGPDLVVRTVTMNFRYAEAFGVDEPPRAYAWLILDAMLGDQTLFARADWIDRAWQIVDPVIERWESAPAADLPNYAAGTAGPIAADRMLERDGRRWRSLVV
jgi:glucose-6-phosphate 1-dehydrogenase